MAFILRPVHGEEIVINAWNWRPILALLRDAKLISDDLYERMGLWGMAKEDAEIAERIADYLDQRLETMKAGERVRADLTVTDEPKKRLVITQNTQADEFDSVEAYSATYEWLVQFRDFSRTSGGFRVL